MQRWLPLLTAAVLSGSLGSSQAQSLISYTFDSDAQSWDNGGNGTVTWNATAGTSGGGCLQVVMDGTTTTEVDPGVAVSINTAQYFTVELDLKIDAASGTTGIGGSGGYGALQMVMRDSGGSWDSSWYGTLYAPAANSYQHYKFVIARPYKPEARVQFQLSSFGNAYSGPVTAYIDNVQITPLPNPWIVNAFQNSSEASEWGWQSWSQSGSSSSLSAAEDAGGGLTPAGALQLDCAFPVAAQWANWSQTVFQKNLSFDPSRFTYLEMDVKVDGANSTLSSDGSYGYFEAIVADSTWSWVSTTPGGLSIPASAATGWTHVKVALPNITAANALILKLSGNAQGPVRLFVDNIKGSNPTTKPRMGGLLAGVPGGTQITMNGPGDQWNREALCVPAGTVGSVNYTWGGQTPATYSMTVTNFPAPADAPGFETHIFITSEDSSAFDQTYGGCDWNTPNLVAFRIENGTNGGVQALIEWKTNSPSSNPTNQVVVSLPSLPSANGTWALNFSSDTTASLVGPGGVLTNFTVPAEMAALFTSPSVSFVQVGAFKNDGQNLGKSDNKSVIFTQVLMTNLSGTIFNDNFGAGLTNNYAWRKSSALAVNWLPQGTAYWLKWSVPDSGFTAQSTANLSGSWSDAGVSYIYTDATGTNRLGAVPAVSLPAGNAAFFRLINTNQ